MRATIKMKLGGTFAVLVLMIVAVVVLGISRMSTLNQTTEDIIAGPMAQLSRAQSIDSKISMVVRAEKNILLSTTDADNQKFSKDILKRRNDANELIIEGVANASPEGKPMWADLQQRWNNYQPISEEIRTLGLENKNEQATKLSKGRGRDAALAMSKAIDGIVDLQRDQVKRAAEGAEATYANARIVMFSAAALALLLAVAGALWISRVVSVGLGRVRVALDAVAVGDLDQEVNVTTNDEIKDLVDTVKNMTASLRKSAALADTIAGGDLTVDHQPLSDKDRLGKALVSMVERLRGVVGDATAAAQNVAAGSQQLSASADQVSQGATEQAAAAEEASASMEQMASNIKQNADNAAQTEKIARQSSKDAENSNVVVQKAVEAMRTIADKISIVQEIARQTDLLALNAAVEAARAGEHGKGFAVVASEVRKLAERSQSAAAEISAVSSDTVAAATQAGDMLTKLVPDIRRTAELVSEISAACREQDIGASQINEAIQQLDQVTQQNAAASEQISSTSEELATQAEELQQGIAYFRISGHDGQAATAPARRAAPAAPKAKPVAKAPAKPAAKAKPKAGSVADQQARARGFALDLSNGGPDGEDAEFGRAA